MTTGTAGPAGPAGPVGTATPPATVSPETTSHNEPTYAATPVGAAESVSAVAAGRTPDRAALSVMPREPSSRYQLISAPNYANIVGGAAPSPIVSVFFAIGILALIGAALMTGLGQGGPEWWLFGALFVVIATTLAGFVSRTAG